VSLEKFNAFSASEITLTSHFDESLFLLLQKKHQKILKACFVKTYFSH